MKNTLCPYYKTRVLRQLPLKYGLKYRPSGGEQELIHPQYFVPYLRYRTTSWDVYRSCRCRSQAAPSFFRYASSGRLADPDHLSLSPYFLPSLMTTYCPHFPHSKTRFPQLVNLIIDRLRRPLRPAKNGGASLRKRWSASLAAVVTSFLPCALRPTAARPICFGLAANRRFPPDPLRRFAIGRVRFAHPLF